MKKKKEGKKKKELWTKNEKLTGQIVTAISEKDFGS